MRMRCTMFVALLIKTIRVMRTVERETTKRAVKLLEWAQSKKETFVTGEPIKVLKYGMGVDAKITFVTFETVNGIEDIYSGGDCLAAAISDTDLKVIIKA